MKANRTSTDSLEIELGRRRNIPSSDRICKRCNLNEVEDEIHFVVACLFTNLKEKLCTV